MSLVYLNGFDELSDSEKFWLNDATGDFLVVTPGRFGRGHALGNYRGGGGKFLRFPFYNYGVFDGTYDTATLGCALKFDYGNWTSNYGSVVFRWYHWVGDCVNVPAGYYETCRLGIDANHLLYVAMCEDGGVPNVVARGRTPLLPLRFYYVEWKVTTHWDWHSIGPGSVTAGLLPTDAGTNEVRLDGVTEIAVPARAVGAGGTGGTGPYVNVMGLSVLAAPRLEVLKYNYDNFRIVTTIDDLYVLNGSGTACNGFLGDVTAQNLRVKAVGTHDDWTLAAGATKAAAVNEVEPDGDAGYVKARQTGYRQTFTFDPVRPGTTSIAGLTLRAVMRKNDLGQRKVTFWANGWTGGTASPGDGYTESVQGLAVNPATGQPWTEADLNSLEAGVQLVQ